MEAMSTAVPSGVDPGFLSGVEGGGGGGGGSHGHKATVRGRVCAGGEA